MVTARRRTPRALLRQSAARLRSNRLPRVVTAIVTALAALAFTTLVAGASPTTTPPAHLAAVGPVDPVNGFPVWYRDSAGLSVGQCLDPKNPMCGLVASPFLDPQQPVAFPDNFPAESFYMLATARITLPGNTTGELVAGLESAFSTTAGPIAGNQVTFGRIRIRIDAPAAGHYTVTHPYGVDEFDVTVPGRRAINFTEDVGVARGNFTGALASRVNPVLTWDTGPVTGPDGASYVGDPAVLHRVTGSALGTNYFRIDGPDIGGAGINTVTSDQFSLLGKVATNFGVDAGRPTYSRSGTDGGFVDVFATSVPGEVIDATLPGSTPTSLTADGSGRYFARLAYVGATPPTSVTVTNRSDSPSTVVTAKVTDRVVVTAAAYDTAAHTLTVRARSSDTATGSGAPPTLSAQGFGPLEASGQQVFAGVVAPPQDVLVSSSAGGSDSAPVEVGGVASLPDPVVAIAGPDQTVRQGQTVTLDGTASLNATGLSWAQQSGPSVALAGTGAKATFTAPTADGTLTFRLTADGPGGPTTDDVIVTVSGVAAPVPKVTGNLTAYPGDAVTLDAAATAGADRFAWAQTAGALVALQGSNTATPTFTMPVTGVPLVFTLTASGPGGSTTATVTVTQLVDRVVVTQASYRTSTREWRVVGTATGPPPDLVTVRLGAADTLIGSAAVDTTGAWSVRVKGAPAGPDASGTVTVTSTRGATVGAVPVQVTP